MSVTAAAAKAGALRSLTLVARVANATVSALSQFDRPVALTEDDLVALFPHLGYQSLTGYNGTREPDLDVRIRTEGLENMLSSNAHGAETVQNWRRRRSAAAGKGFHAEPTWLLETTHGRKVGVDVQGISVTRQPVDGGLFLGGLLLDNSVRLSLGWCIDSGSRTSVDALLLAVETAAASEHDCALVLKDRLARRLVDGLDNHGDCRCLSLVEDFEKLDLVDQGRACRNGCLDLEVLFTVQELCRVKVGHKVEAKRARGSELGNDTKGGQCLELVRAFKDEWQFTGLGTDTQVVKHDIPVIIGEFDGFKLVLLGLSDRLWVFRVDVLRAVFRFSVGR